MNAFVKKSFAVAAMSFAMAAGVSVAAPALASADPVTDTQACGTALAKGGPRACSGDGSAPLSEFEKDCLQGALSGAVPGGIVRDPREMARGAVGGCLSSATAD